MEKSKKTLFVNCVVSVLLVLILLAGSALRLMNVNWDEGRHLHPDERFLSQVISFIRPVDSIREYFDTSQSKLNPNNHNFGFFVYGTLPVFIIRYVGEWTGQTGYDLNTIVGRKLSAYFDIATILLVFLIGLFLYNKWVGLGGAALYAFAVLPIQLAHFMTVDSFTNTFGMLTVLVAVLILRRPMHNVVSNVNCSIDNKDGDTNRFKISVKDILLFVFFGIALGMATASKINAISLALLLPLVEIVRWLKTFGDKRDFSIWPRLALMVLAGIVSFLTFRFFQPYAFDGPGFFDMKINQGWWGSMQALRGQATGEVDFPPALQWTRRELTFSVKNLVLWGVGIPFAITALLGVIVMLYKMIKRKEYIHLPVLAWTTVYFAWQGFAWVKSMRYLLLIYPLLAVISGWIIYKLIAEPAIIRFKEWTIPKKAVRIFGVVLAAITVLGTAAYAWAFTRIYTRPVTRVEATDWIIENIPGPINLKMKTGQQEINYPVGYRYREQLNPGEILKIAYQAETDSQLVSLYFPTIEVYTGENDKLEYQLNIKKSDKQINIVDAIAGHINYTNTENTRAELTFQFNGEVQLKANDIYVFEIVITHEEGSIYFEGQPRLVFSDKAGKQQSRLLSSVNERITIDSPYRNKVYIAETGAIEGIELPFVLDVGQNEAQKTMTVTLSTEGGDPIQSQSVVITDPFTDIGDGRGRAYSATFEESIIIAHPQVLDIEISIQEEIGALMLSAFAPVHESSWDDGLPTSKPGFIGYASSGGLYQGGLNLELYWPDDSSKLERIKETLISSDYIFITSNRQWGTISRVPERYPLTTYYYEQLMGCPETIDVVTCYNIAEPDMFEGNLGFELYKTFTSYPTLFGIEFNDQFAEEAFSVYDHPKVIIFKKTEDFEPKLLDKLDTIDLNKAVFLTPKEAHSYKAPKDGEKSLMLSDSALSIQQSGGTWSELFNREDWQNRSQVVSVLIFYLFVTLLGWIVFPITHIAFKGLFDRGYAFSKVIGLLLFAWVAYTFGSQGVLVTRSFLWIILLLILLISAIITWFTRRELVVSIKSNWKQFIVIEAFGLITFLFFLWIRYLNPDLWHQWKGGEKPMDFSYLNAVIKSDIFPAYDPWFAGGYINYYYYGQVIVGMPVKALGIVPSVAYNIILPLWYSLLMIATFSVGWNISRHIKQKETEKLFGVSFWTGIASALLVGFLGNLGEMKVISDAWVFLGSQGKALQDLSLSQRIVSLFKGIGATFKGQSLPIPPGNWYWNPSRTIPGEPITEFPYFTFLYGDLHAHLIALPIVMCSVGWSLSLLFQKIELGGAKLKHIIGLIINFIVGALIIGALKPTNTWDVYTFFALAACVLVYIIMRYGVGLKLPKTREWQSRLVFSVIAVGLLYGLSMLMYNAFNSHFMPGFTKIGFWEGDRTPITSYFLHWGLPLFILVGWFIWESIKWAKDTKISELRALKHFNQLMLAIAIASVALLIVLLTLKVSVAIIALPMCVWALLLLLSHRQSDSKRFVFFIIGTAFLLTLVVELVHLVGDIGRMNVVFKLYMQAWLLMNIAAGTALVIMLNERHLWKERTQLVFCVPLLVLFLFALLFPIFASRDKATDRISLEAPHTLDGMKYMESASYHLDGIRMNLGEDYRAIMWLQENVVGSPVILEAQAFEYQWGNRFTVYTGLPSVVGWNYHQRQQRAIWANNDVWDRVDRVNHFYQTIDIDFVKEYLKEHKVSYIVVGQQERIRYYGEGLDKFETYLGQLWDMVYTEGDTVIYKVR